MSTNRIPETVRRMFAETFTARDIARPLASFEASAPASEVRAFMAARGLDVVGVREDGLVAGYVAGDALGDDTCEAGRRDFDEAAVVDDTAPLLSVLRKLSRLPHVFVRVLGRVGGVIVPGDLQSAPVRMWLFGLLTLIEMHFTDLIERHCPGDAWKQYLSEARLAKAEQLLAERKRRNQGLRLLDCLQFSDRGQVIARNEALRRLTVFPSRSQAEETVKRLEQLRNNLAHSQDILVSDWDTIVGLSEFVAQGEAP